MRFTTFTILSALLGLTAACGASSETISPGPGIQNEASEPQPYDLKSEGTLMAPEENGSFEESLEAAEENDDYFGDETEIIDEKPGVHPADRVEPATDLTEPSRTGPSLPRAGDRIEPAEIGDARLQYDPAGEVTEIQPEEGAEPDNEEIIDETTPREHP